MENSSQVFNIMFTKQHKLFLEVFNIAPVHSENLGTNAHLALTLQANIEAFGFSFSKPLLLSLSHASEDKLTDLWKTLVTQAKVITGAHQKFKPMYPNFPEQVLKASDVELMLNAFMHYAGDWVGLRILPKYEEKVRLPLLDKVTPKLLDIAYAHDVEQLFFNLISANTSLSESDKDNVSQIFTYLGSNAAELLNRANISQKENLAYVGNLVLKSSLDFNSLMAHQFTTPTDLLRLSAAMFGGDISLATPTKVGRMSRPMRKAFLARLETQLTDSNDASQLVENLFTYKEMWVRLGHALHQGEHANKFPLTASVFEDLRANRWPVTFNSQVEQLLSGHAFAEATQLLASRPGVMARNLNRLLPHVPEEALLTFERVASNVATPVLLQLHSHFLHQHEKSVRTFMPKGGLSKLFVVNANDKIVPEQVALTVVDICEKTLLERFKAFPSLGRVYVDPALKLQNVPFAMRSASKDLHSVARGSRFDVEEQDTVRLFVWWAENGLNKEGQKYGVGRVDIDLSCVLMDKAYRPIDVCTYWNLHDRESGAFAHSGDITSAPHGAAEFIDINLKKLNPEVRYIVMTISSYTQQKYCDLPECFAGWMMRDKPQSGKIFDARTVKNKVDITSEATQMMPAIFDTETRQFIWADMAVKVNMYGVNNVANNISGIGYNVKGITTLVKPNLYDLFRLHAEARGTIVESKAEADTVFSLHEGVTPYMFDRIASEFMADTPPAQLVSQKKI